MTSRNFIRTRGFSLLEVLIAVAILAFGLLALASLQAALIRSGADAKARSVALSVAKDRVEELRAYRAISDFEALTDSADVVVDGIAGGVDYAVTTTVTRYGFNTDPNNDGDTADGAFVLIADDSADQVGNFADENEFKRVSVSVGWTDANGVAQTVVVEDAIGSVAPENTGKIARRDPDSAQRRPQILITDPSLDDGVIPIAVGDGSETAATNPRPDVDTGIKRQTSYDIFTFAALSGNSGNAVAQSRVETVIIGCQCDTDTADTGQISYRPTVWDGERYQAPEEAVYAPQAGQARLRNNDPAQSILCTACCRDHRDPSGAEAPLFSPRLDEHNHFLNDLTTAVGSGEYYEACRMIRVDGIHRVSSDPYNEYTNTLKTATAVGETEPFTAPAPDEIASDDYVRFVIAYLQAQAGQSDANVQITQTEADSLASVENLETLPLTVEVGDERWMHARGLYLDWLEADALEAIDEATTVCPDATGLSASECLLRAMPFTSINVTELARWTPDVAASAPVYVANNDFIDSTLAETTGVDPVRGRVTAASAGTRDALATIRTSNTGLLADATFRISPNDQTAQTNNIGDQPDADGQGFTIEGPRCGSLPSTGSIAAGAFYPYPTISPCAGSDSTKPIAATRVILTLSTGAGPRSSQVDLIAPDGSIYPVAPAGTDFATIGTSYSFAAIGNPRLAGTWTVRVTNTGNGQAVSTTLGFSVAFEYTARFSALFSGYDFTTITQPSGLLSVGGNCSFTGSINPTTCNITRPNVATAWTVGTYNYQTTKASTSISCTGGAAGMSCPSTLACKRFDVNSVAIDNGQSASFDAPLNDGKLNESTILRFGGISDGARITVGFTANANDAPTCVYGGTGNTAQCNKYVIACQ